MGRDASKEVEASIGSYEDPALERYVQDLGMRLVAVSERKNLPWTFRVADDPAVNAFALPGGFVYVTRGILAHLDNEAQLAAVMGHEVGHVTAQHSVEQVSRAELANVGLGLGSLLSSEVRRFGGIGQLGLQVLFLKFGRDDERQADALGMRYAVKAKYDPREMAKVFETLKRVSEQEGGGQRLPTWLATHPDPEERVKKSEERVAKLKQSLKGLAVDAPGFMKVVDGVTYGEDPSGGFFRAERFYQPQLRFSIAFPAGWQTMNSKQAVVAQSPDKDAALQLTAASGGSAEQVLQQFFADSGAERGSSPEKLGPGLAATFRGDSEQGEVAGLAAGIQDGEHSYLVLAICAVDAYDRHEGAFRNVVESFQHVDDPKLLDVKPARLRVEKLSRPTSLAQLHERHSGVAVAELALINQVSEGETLAAGRYVKWIEPGTANAEQP